MAESQVVEYKESWKDEYLKWICGFANAQGGRIYIGINDKGEVIGVKDIKKLLEDIPNKIRDKLGIIADVNRLEKDGIAYIEIIVAPSGVPINYQGEYHYRSGSTKQLLQGLALTQFLMEKTGIKWDSVSANNISADDLDEVSIEIFKREALRKKRISEADLKVSRTELLDHLNLIEDDKLKRAAVMLFHKRPSKLVEGCYVKIGKFGEGADLQYQDQLEGSLFRIADQVIDLIYTKYLKAKITYEHNVRVETYPFPIDGVREAIYNALAHNNYARCVPIQIRIQDDAMFISNSCILPSGWDVESLLQPHRSVPFNPAIANAFYRAGYIETWGRGIQKIYESCKELGVPAPEYSIVGEDITVKFTAHDSIFSEIDGTKHDVNGTNGTNHGTNHGTNDNGTLSVIESNVLAAIINNPYITKSQLIALLGIGGTTVSRTTKKLKELGYIERSGTNRTGHWVIIK